MHVLANLSIRAKLGLMLVVPLLGLLFFSGYGITVKQGQSAEMGRVGELSRLAVHLSALVHETQKERGMTAGYLGSKGEKFARELPEQRALTDGRAEELRAYLAEFDAASFGAEFAAVLNAGVAELDRIGGVRGAVTDLSIPTGEAIGYYTGMNGKMLGTVAEVIKVTDNGVIGRELSAYVAFLQGKERAGIERAVLTNTFARDSFGKGMFKKYGALVAAQDTYNSVFLSLATPEAKQFYSQTMSAGAVKEVDAMRQVAFDKAASGGFGIEPGQWFQTITEKINLLKEVENKLSDDLIAHASALQAEARGQLSLFAVLAAVAVAVSMAAAWVMQRAISGPLNLALSAMEDIADGEGDLTRRLEVRGKDEVARVAAAFNRFAEKIQQVVVRIKAAAESIHQSSGEIAAGSMDLSSRTEQQASSLEETAASMEEMTATVRQNADHARQANELAGQARGMAEKGGTVVSDAVSAMGEINTFSSRIAEIIGVIDEIAFQTNLLALNAAVEAARAGEQGRGFAVVAGEVRSLAQRSSDAAREIRELINTSVEKVKAGSALVDDSGHALEEIVQSVVKVTEIVSEIAAATREQTGGIDQVSSAIREMDDVTQQNAALVEESSAASEAMRDQAQHLANLMAQFKVEEEAAGF